MIFLAILSSGLGLIAFRNSLFELFAYFRFPDQTTKIIDPISTVAFLFTLWFSTKSPFMGWLWLLFVIVLGQTISPITIKWINHRIEKYTIHFLDEVILNIRSGYGLRKAIYEAATHQHGILRTYFMELHNIITSNNSTSQISFPCLRHLLVELMEIDHSQTKAFNQLSALRQNMKIEMNLKLKMKRSTQQARSQALLLTMLQISITLFVSVYFGFKKNVHIISISNLLFIAGMWGMIFIQRGFKWKI